MGVDGMQEKYLALNRANWDERAPAHVRSPGYGVDALLADPRALSGVVEFDRPRLGDVAGLRGVHLQCHIGTDTLSLARLGADMTGLDFSPAAVRIAGELAARAGVEVRYVEQDVYAAPQVLPVGTFDLVYTGIGALCWLPDVHRWAQVVAELLAPGGRLFMRETHPVLWALGDPGADGRLVVEYPYFETVEPTVWDEPGTYVETDATFTKNVTCEWNHGLGEVLGALFDAGLRVTALEEHTSVPWNAFAGHMVEIGGGEWTLRERPERLPHSYTVQAVKG